MQSNTFVRGVIIIACSDAMAIRGAGITFTPEGVEIQVKIYTWNAKESPLSINWREPASAIRTVLWILHNNPKCTKILLGVDNSTAFAALSRRIFATDELLQEEQDSMFAHQIPGVMLAADEPSRGEKALKHKMIKCAKLLLEPRDATWWQCLKKRRRGSF